MTKNSKQADKDIKAYLKECSKLKGAALREAYAQVVGRDTNETNRERLLNGIARILYHDAEQGAVVPVFEHPGMNAKPAVKRGKKPNDKKPDPAFDDVDSETRARSSSNAGDSGADAHGDDDAATRDIDGDADASGDGAGVASDAANAPDNANGGASPGSTADGTVRVKKRRMVRSQGTRDPRLPAAGTLLERKYKDQTIKVTLLSDNGCLHEGRAYKSLSGFVKALTGTNHNGLLWFGLAKRESKTSPAKPAAAAMTNAAQAD